MEAIKVDEWLLKKQKLVKGISVLGNFDFASYAF
jgi:hypothetical protein